MYSQDEEELFIKQYFKNKKSGYLVDVGAADGKTNSNSYALINELSWGGVLVEPHPSYFKSLVNLYENRTDIKLCDYAVWKEAGTVPFYIFGTDETAQVSTIDAEFKERVIAAHGNLFNMKISVPCDTLNNILILNRCSKKIDFLDIDCEGSDIHAISSIDLSEFDIQLICVELSMDKKIIDDILVDSHRFIKQVGGNGFWEKKI